MKIVSLRLQNLGSLSGTWCIDFTDPAFAENSIFAITGPTGAGKSTLLDGLCLALYGATPRLGKITKSTNQIMSRHSGTCFAEVEFSTNKGLFRCHWSQHRSRNKSRGELQQPRHEIVDAEHGNVLASKIRDVASKVEAVTGMDFERFTRSTLLAQGGFAAFLEASDDERSPILEQITGTEVYSNISKKVHELYQIELTTLRDFEQTLTGISILPPEEEKQLNEEMRKADTEVLATTASLKDLVKQHNWLTKLRHLKEEFTRYQNQLQDLEKEQKLYAPQLHSLKEALAAREIESLYQALKKLQTLALEEGLEQKALKQKQHSLEKRQAHQRTLSEKAATALIQTEQKREEGLKLIREVRKLDSTIDNANQQYTKQDIEYRKAKEKCAASHIRLKELLHKKNQAEVSKKQLDDYFSRNGADEQLLEKLGVMEGVLARIEELNSQQKVLQGTQKQLLDDLEQCNKQDATLAKELQLIKEKDTATTLLLQQTQKKISTILQGRDADGLLQEQFSTANRHKKIDDLILLLEQIALNGTELKVLGEQQLENTAKGKKLAQQLSAAQTISTGQQRTITLLEKNILLLVRVQNLEKDRQQLEDSLPCPLCGSTTHPYAQDKTPEAADEEQQLQLAKSQQAVTQLEISDLSSQTIRIQERSISQSKEEAEKNQQIRNSKNCVRQLLAELDFPEDFEITVPLLRQEKEQLALLQKERQQQIQDLKKLDNILETLKKEKEGATTIRQTLELTLVEARHQKAASSKALKENSSRERKVQEDSTQRSTELSDMLHPFSSQGKQADTARAQLQDFRSRISRWRDKKVEDRELGATLIRLNAEYTHTASLCATDDKVLLHQRASCEQNKTELSILQEKRSSLFGNKKTEAEEDQLEQQMLEARKRVQLLQQEQAGIRADLTAGVALLERIDKVADKRSLEISNQQQHFQESIAASIFDSSENFLKARLTTDETDTLQQLHSRLQQREVELKTLCQERQTSLLLEQEKKLCSEKAELLEERIKQQEQQLNTLQVQAISRREQLKRNNEDKNKVEEQLRRISTQKAISSRWSRLHMLIGSADGKKFRNFAQGLTFELMVYHANTHLKRMSKRYILIRDTSSPLDLNVIDTYQADEIRSTKNLSGGESFLVSLALALGLSRMSSRNVRVDSLFLDEGFGTLDENALESALETLARLREENKLIGVISHVRTLQERVPLQIQIIPGSGGRSRITGPGVSRGS